MSAPEDDEGRTVAEDGTQREPESQVGGGRSSRGPALSTGGEQEPGGVVPPYDGRKESAEPDQAGGTSRDGARVGGATGPVDDERPKAPAPSETPGGATASPGDEQPAADMPETAPDEGQSDTGSHVSGVAKGERGGS
jgi:hypothetical protein